MKVSEQVLDSLPIDDVHEELMAIMRKESSSELAERETAAYVPDTDSENEEEEEDEARLALGAYSDKEGKFTRARRMCVHS